MWKFFRFTLLLSLAICTYLGYLHFTIWEEATKDLITVVHDYFFEPMTWSMLEFHREFNYYLVLFLSGFWVFFSFMMSWMMNIWVVFLIPSMIFVTVAIKTEMYSFIFWAIWFLVPFILFSIVPKVSSIKLNKLKSNGIKVQWDVVDIIIDYSVKINSRPSQKLVIQVMHPVTWQLTQVTSAGSFDPYFKIWAPKVVDVYFDRINIHSYSIDLKDKAFYNNWEAWVSNLTQNRQSNNNISQTPIRDDKDVKTGMFS
jgi:hypothetical protein